MLLSKCAKDCTLPLSERLVKEIARAINKNINEIGGYRTVSVLIIELAKRKPSL